MTHDALESAVLAFLERRESEPLLTPEEFVSSRADAAPGALEAIRAALALEDMFPSEGQQLRRIGSYRLLGEIGRGGMGIVYRAERDGRRFALKLLPLAPLVGPRVLERFRREAGTLAHLSHPGIVRVHDAGMHEEVPYLVMDLVDGEPLHRLNASLTIAEAVRIVEALAGILAAAHRQGVLHRDLKPQNVMVRPDGSPVLLDFGLSAADEFPTLTASDEILGTPRYMAPEQILGGTVDARTDLYALGLILFELVTKRPAHEETSRDALLEAVRLGRVPRPRTIARSLSRDLEKVILGAIARRPERRYQNASAMAEDLGRYRRGEPVAARPPGPVARAIEAVRAHRPRGRATAAAAGSPAAIPGPRPTTPAPDARESAAGAHRAAAAAAVRLDRLDDAANAYRRALELAPESAETWTEFAEVCLRRRDLDEGLRAIMTAESLSATEDARILRIRAALEVHSGRPIEARRLLARLLEIAPDDAEARFEMAYSLDTEHDLAGAEHGYRRVLEVAPSHVRALIGLAYLHSGASRGQCRSCDEAFAAHPEHFDLDKAERYLLRAIDEDRGRSEAVTHTIRDVALRLERRDAVVALLERLTAESTHASSVLRLKDVLRRIRLAGA